MKHDYNTFETNCAIANKVMLHEHLDEVIKEMLDMTIAYGARAWEHFMAIVGAPKSFVQAKNRSHMSKHYNTKAL